MEKLSCWVTAIFGQKQHMNLQKSLEYERRRKQKKRKLEPGNLIRRITMFGFLIPYFLRILFSKYTHARACAHTHTCMCPHTHTPTHTPTHARTHARTHAHTHTQLFSFQESIFCWKFSQQTNVRLSLHSWTNGFCFRCQSAWVAWVTCDLPGLVAKEGRLRPESNSASCSASHICGHSRPGLTSDKGHRTGSGRTGSFGLPSKSGRWDRMTSSKPLSWETWGLANLNPLKCFWSPLWCFWSKCLLTEWYNCLIG